MPSSPFAGPPLSASSALWNMKSAFWVFVNDSSSCRTRVPNRTRVFNPTGCEGVTLHDKGDLGRLSCIVPMAPCNQGEAELNIWNREVMQEVRLKNPTWEEHNLTLLALQVEGGDSTSQVLKAPKTPCKGGKGEETDSPVTLPEGIQLCWTLDFSPVRPTWYF